MFVQFNIWVKDGQNEGPQTCLNLCVWRPVPQLSKEFSLCGTVSSIWAALCQQTAFPWCFCNISFPSLFVLLLPLQWLLTGNIPRKTSGDWLPLYFGAADRVCVLLTAAVLQLLGTEGGIASQEDEEGSWTEVKAHQEKKDRDNGWARTPEQGGARGPGTPDPLSHTHLQSWPLQLPSLLSFWPPTEEDISIAPKTFANAGPEEGTVLSWCQMRAIWPVQRNRSYRKGSETSVIWTNDSSHFYLL